MTRLLWFVLGLACCAVALSPAPLAVAMPALPAPRERISALPMPAEPAPEIRQTAATMQPAGNPVTAVGMLGLANVVQCWNCAPFEQRVHLSHYDPMSGAINCWDYDEEQNYCYSPTKPGIEWKGLWGIGAACPMEWPYGTWVVVPEVGAFICLDRGGSIVCDKDGICNVDILGPSGPWDGSIVTATLWVPLDPPRED